jgi:hypothetical protein
MKGKDTASKTQISLTIVIVSPLELRPRLTLHTENSVRSENAGVPTIRENHGGYHNELSFRRPFRF